MKPGRVVTITTLQAILGTIAIALAIAAVIGLSYLLLLPADDVPLLPPPDVGEDVRDPGEIACPSGQNLAQRPTPMPVTSAELIECPALFDGEQIRYDGEAVGEVLLRPRDGWVHVNDDLYAVQIGPVSEHRTVAGGNSGMAVSMPRTTAASIVPGGHRREGTNVSVVGTFLRSDPRDDGAPAIRATSVDIVSDVRVLGPAPVSVRRIVAAVVSALLTAALFAARRRARRED